MSLNDFNVLGNTPAPATSVDVCLQDGFALNSGATITGGNGAILVDGEAFEWKPWEVLGHKNLLNKKGQFELPAEAFAVFDVLWPRPGSCCPPDGSLQIANPGD
jgi:NADH dehydrogenase [ubiquinone] 1 alpha subcomplex assembly factor 3